MVFGVSSMGRSCASPQRPCRGYGIVASMELPFGMASGDRDRSLIEYYLDDEGTTTTMYGILRIFWSMGCAKPL